MCFLLIVLEWLNSRCPQLPTNFQLVAPLYQRQPGQEIVATDDLRCGRFSPEIEFHRGGRILHLETLAGNEKWKGPPCKPSLGRECETHIPCSFLFLFNPEHHPKKKKSKSTPKASTIPHRPSPKAPGSQNTCWRERRE